MRCDFVSRISSFARYQQYNIDKKYSDTGSRTRVCSVKANRASRYTISDIY
ncbi:unnamed protein product [Debaryomyces tyrocola]|nr:unnamed protein product [Debaryomyces tyrocola]